MPTFTLQVNIDPSWVSQIVQAQQNLIVTKQSAAQGGQTVAWLAFSPYQSNTISWQDTYYVYTSQTLLQAGATITQLASTQAAPQTAYSFQSNVFTVATPYSQLSASQYEIINQSGQPLVFGLAQGATLNGNALSSSPIFAATVLNNQWLDMTPLDTVSVFLQGNVNSAMCLGTVTGKSCQVNFGNGVSSQTINFNSGLGGFQLA